MDIDWSPLRPIIEQNKTFVLSSHVRPDADALGSELAMAAVLESMGKTVRIVNPSDAPESLRFLDPLAKVRKLGDGVTSDDVTNADVHMVLDTSSWTQLAEVGKLLRASRATKVVIDHHVSSDDLGAIEFKDSTAEATGALVFQLLKAFNWPLSRDGANALFCAIATDTGWFRFSSTTSRTLFIAGQLIDLGADPALLYRLLYEQYSPARIKLTAKVLARVSQDANGRLAYTSVLLSDFKETGAKPADTEDLVNECLRIAGTQAAFIAVEQQNGNVKFSLRSRGELDVAKIAESFGGGGHKQAAGTVLPGPPASAIAKVLSAFKTALESPSAPNDLPRN